MNCSAEKEKELLSRSAAVICVYNHAGRLREIVERTLKQGCRRTIVVDDGSVDCDVGKVLAGMSVTLLRHPVNLGKGAALQTALNFLERKKTDFMITLDADGQHDPENLRNFLPELGEDVLTIGVRTLDRHSPSASRIGCFFSNLCFYLGTGRRIQDSQSGFRAYPVKLCAGISCRGTRYAWETEMLIRAVRSGAGLRQVPVHVHYQERVSHFQPWRDTFRIIGIHLLLNGERLRKFFHLSGEKSTPPEK